MSLLMLAVVALFPVALLAILLLTSGLEGKFVSPGPPEVQQVERADSRASVRRD